MVKTTAKQRTFAHSENNIKIRTITNNFKGNSIQNKILKIVKHSFQ